MKVKMIFFLLSSWPRQESLLRLDLDHQDSAVSDLIMTMLKHTVMRPADSFLVCWSVYMKPNSWCSLQQWPYSVEIKPLEIFNPSVPPIQLKAAHSLSLFNNPFLCSMSAT